MVRAPFYDENGVKKGAWSVEEDEKLKAYVQEHGHCNWRELPRLAGLSRCGKSCRLRWINYLRPDVKRGNYSKEEEELILQLHKQHGNKWSQIATRLPGRTDNEIKNYWHTHLKKQKSTKVTKKQQNKKSDEMKTNSLNEVSSDKIFESSSFSSEMSTVCSNQESTEDSPPTRTFKFEDSNIYNNGDFWTDPLVANNFEAEYEYPMYFDVIGGFNPPYDFEYDEDLQLYQVMKELPHNYLF